MRYGAAVSEGVVEIFSREFRDIRVNPGDCTGNQTQVLLTDVVD